MPPSTPIPDDSSPLSANMPLTLTASLILTSLPTTSTTLLSTSPGALTQQKITIRFQPVGSAPTLRQKVFKVSSAQRFETVVNFLRKKLGAEVRAGESVFCYVNSVFAPALDEGVGELWRCFRTGEELVVAYAKMPAFG